VRHLILLLVSILLFSINFASAQKAPEIPKDFDEAQGMGEKALTIGIQELPGLIGKALKEEVIPVWINMYHFVWTDRIAQWLFYLWEEARGLAGQEVEKRTPYVEEKIDQVNQTTWERFKDLFE